MSWILEVCVDSVESAIAAEQGGADRIELCSSLLEGGVTPSHGLIQQVCRALSTCKVHVLIRPRGGDFLYSESEIGVIKQDILLAASIGAHGIVLGFLTPAGTIDVNLTGYFVDLCSALGEKYMKRIIQISSCLFVGDSACRCIQFIQFQTSLISNTYLNYLSQGLI